MRGAFSGLASGAVLCTLFFVPTPFAGPASLLPAPPSPLVPGILGTWQAGAVWAVNRTTHQMHVDHSATNPELSDNSLMPYGQRVEFTNGYDKAANVAYWQVFWQVPHPANACQYPFFEFRYVVVADAVTLATLPAGESQALRAAISRGRLGLVLLAEAAPLPAAVPARAAFVVQPLPVAGAGPQPLRWPGAPAPVRALLPARLRAGAALRPLITGPGAALVAAGQRYGLGRVVVSVVPETFRWALQGQARAYASFWSQLLAAAAPPPAPAATWQVLRRWPRPRQPLTLRLAGAVPTGWPTAQPLAGGPAAALALAQDVRLPEWRTAQYWPARPGWHQLRGPGRTAHSFYVYDSAAWRGPELLARQQALAERTRSLGAVAAATTATVPRPWPAGWFFGLFLLAAGFLWLEEKL